MARHSGRVLGGVEASLVELAASRCALAFSGAIPTILCGAAPPAHPAVQLAAAAIGPRSEIPCVVALSELAHARRIA